MKKQTYRQFLFLFALLMLFFALSTPKSFAKKALGLELQSSVINTSSLDKSKNTLVIENPKGLRSVLIMPKDRSAKPLKLQGNLQDGKLLVDLNKLGSLQGSYLVIAKRGGKKLQAEFELNAPTVYRTKLSVPLNSLSKKAKERVLRYHHSEGSICYSDPCPNIPPDKPQCLAPVIEVSCDDPSCNSGPCTNGKGTSGDTGIEIKCSCFDPENLGGLAKEQYYHGEIEGDNIVADVTLETFADYQKEDCGIKAEVLVEGEQEASLSTVAFLEGKDEEGNVKCSCNNATTAATDIYIAANTDTQDLTVEGEKIEDISFEDLFNKTVQKCEPLIGLPQSADTSKAFIANIAQDIALEIKDAITNALGTENPADELRKLAAETAAKFGAQCPNFVDLPDEALVKMAELATVGYHEIASGLLDPMKLGIDQNAQVFIDMYEKEGIVAGSLKPPSYEEALKAFKAGTAPVYTVDPTSLATNFGELQKAASESGKVISSEIQVPPGTIFNPAQAVSSLKEDGIGNATFNLAPTCIVQGEYDPSKFSSAFKFNAEPGVIADQSFAGVFNSIELGQHDFLPGTVIPSGGTQAVLPPAVQEYINATGLTAPTNWFNHPPTEGTSIPVPTGSTPSIQPVPDGWHPPTDSHPMPTGTVIPTVTQPVAVTQPVVQPTYVPPPTESHPMTH